jgi:formamidopyrimidine-DNA glycosylase
VPELPDVEAYRLALDQAIGGQPLLWLRLYHPFLLRSVGIPPEQAIGAGVVAVHRYGKRIALEFSGDTFFVFHLMIAGRFKWKPAPEAPARPPGRPNPRSGVLAHFGFESGILSLTEAGSKRRASLHVVGSVQEAEAMNRGGMELLDSETTLEAFTAALRRENHTLKRSLTDPRLYSGIGNSYSDEILFAAGLSPFSMSQSLSDADVLSLFTATVDVLREWTDRFLAEAAAGFPTRVTAFRDEMHVHGKYNQPCDVCGTPVQRIRYAENECNYCPTCQTGGKVYADRALSRLLKSDWPRTVEELEKLGGPPGS